MKKLLGKIRSRKGSRIKDGASATLITTLISLMFILSCTALSVDLAKNAYLKQALTSRAQEAASGAIRSVESTGSLGAVTVEEFHRIYMGRDYVLGGQLEQAAYKNDESNRFQSSKCENIEVPWYRDAGSGQKQQVVAPYMVYQLNTDRSVSEWSNGIHPNGWSPTYISSGTTAPVRVDGNTGNHRSWVVMDVRVHDSRANLFLGMFGMPCQTYTMEVGALKFGENSDVRGS